MKNKINQLSNWISKNFMSLLLFSILFSMSSTEHVIKVDDAPAKELAAVIIDLRQQLENMTCELEDMKTIINDPYTTAIRYKKEQSDYKKFLKEQRMYPGTNFEFQPYLQNYDITTELLAALIAYEQLPDSPKDVMKVNSATRKGNIHSRHYYGNAIDIHYSCVDDFLVWTQTQEGRNWLEQYQISFYIEDNHSGSKFLVPWREEMDNYVLINPHATGPHVHLQYIGKNA